jgi:hypothetical protein
VNNLLAVRENDENAIDFTLHLLSLFGLVEFGLSVYGSCYLLRTLV